MEESILTSKIIGIVVSVIVLCAVLVPITQGLSDSNNGGDTADSEPAIQTMGDSTADYVVLNDLNTAYAPTGLQFPSEYKSFQYFNRAETPAMPSAFHFDLEDFDNLINGTTAPTLSEDSRGYARFYIVNIELPPLSDVLLHERVGVCIYVDGSESSWELNMGNQGLIPRDRIAEMSVDITPEYNCTFVCVDTNNQTFTKTGLASSVWYPSDSDKGWIVGAHITDGGDGLDRFNVRVQAGSKIYLGGEYYFWFQAQGMTSANQLIYQITPEQITVTDSQMSSKKIDSIQGAVVIPHTTKPVGSERYTALSQIDVGFSMEGEINGQGENTYVTVGPAVSFGDENYTDVIFKSCSFDNIPEGYEITTDEYIPEEDWTDDTVPEQIVIHNGDTVQLYPYGAYVELVSTYAEVGEGGASDSDGASSSDSTFDTILSIIPVFVAIAIILGTVGLLYTAKNES